MSLWPSTGVGAVPHSRGSFTAQLSRYPNSSELKAGASQQTSFYSLECYEDHLWSACTHAMRHSHKCAGAAISAVATPAC